MNDLETLYPFLSPSGVDQDGLLEQVQRSIESKIQEIARLRADAISDSGPRLLECARAVAGRLRRGGRILTMGNGGSSTDAQALAALFLHPLRGQAWPAWCLTADVAVVTALSNDVGFDVVFSRQVAAHGRPDDVLIGLSTSGNSENLLQGFAAARSRGMLTAGFSGAGGGRMADPGRIDYLFVVPIPSVHRIQETQTTLYHTFWELVQQAARV